MFLGGMSYSEFDAREKAVGPFRAGIPCKDRESDAWFLIENQLKRTDHPYREQLYSRVRDLGPKRLSGNRPVAVKG